MVIPRPATVEDGSDGDNEAIYSNTTFAKAAADTNDANFERLETKAEEHVRGRHKRRESDAARKSQGGNSNKRRQCNNDSRIPSKRNGLADEFAWLEHNKSKPRPKSVHRTELDVQQNLRRAGLAGLRSKTRQHEEQTSQAKEQVQTSVPDGKVKTGPQSQQPRQNQRKIYDTTSKARDEAWKPIKEKEKLQPVDLIAFVAMIAIIIFFFRRTLSPSSPSPHQATTIDAKPLLRLSDEKQLQRRESWLENCILLDPSLYSDDTIKYTDQLRFILTISQSHIDDLKSSLTEIHAITAHLAIIERLLLHADVDLRPAIAALRGEHLPARHRWAIPPSSRGAPETHPSRAGATAQSNGRARQIKPALVGGEQIHGTKQGITSDFLHVTAMLQMYYQTLHNAVVELYTAVVPPQGHSYFTTQKILSLTQRFLLQWTGFQGDLPSSFSHRNHAEDAECEHTDRSCLASIPAALDAAESACALSVRQPWTLAMKHTWLRRHWRFIDWLVGTSRDPKHPISSQTGSSEEDRVRGDRMLIDRADRPDQGSAGRKRRGGGEVIDTLTSRVYELRGEVLEHATNLFEKIEAAKSRLERLKMPDQRGIVKVGEGKQTGSPVGATTQDEDMEGVGCKKCGAKGGSDSGSGSGSGSQNAYTYVADSGPGSDSHREVASELDINLSLEQRVTSDLTTLYTDLLASLYRLRQDLGDVQSASRCAD